MFGGLKKYLLLILLYIVIAALVHLSLLYSTHLIRCSPDELNISVQPNNVSAHNNIFSHSPSIPIYFPKNAASTPNTVTFSVTMTPNDISLLQVTFPHVVKQSGGPSYYTIQIIIDSIEPLSENTKKNFRKLEERRATNGIYYCKL